jgi:dTDP-glucose 4,6-dehydratase
MSTMRRPRTVLVTGGCGFIGSHFIRHVLRVHPKWSVINLDKLTYAADPTNLMDVAEAHGHARQGTASARYRFVRGDIRDQKLIQRILRNAEPRPVSAIIHFAAETHVDRSIQDASPFIETNVLGTQILLEAARSAWVCRGAPESENPAFLYVSTDEVYGPSDDEGVFSESTSLRPTSPYAVSKAAADLLCQSYRRAYRLPVLIARLSNQYGPNQLPEKLVPKAICDLLHGEPIPIYGRGEEKRSWLYVEDACLGLERVLCRGRNGEIYNVPGFCEQRNIDLVQEVSCLFDRMALRDPTFATAASPHERIQFVPDPRGAVHDSRYAMDGGKMAAELSWSPQTSLGEGLRRTIRWYSENRDWIDRALRRLAARPRCNHVQEKQ